MFITAASAVVFIGLGGSALDISRMYLVKSRLQQACDAGVLAYRRSMQGTNIVPGKAGTNDTAQAYFNANFTSGKYETSNVSFPEPTVDANVVVHGTATVTTPMTLMKLFGFEDVQIEAKCDAQLQLPNTDVMFVLDTTGSMNDINAGDSESKIAVLRKAVTSFYNTLESAKVAGTQVRYGFVPYSNTVNVGMLLKRDWMVDSATYQSRKFDVQKQEATGSTQGQTVTTYTGWTPNAPSTSSTSFGNSEACVAPANTATATNTSNSAWNPDATSLPRSRTNTRTYGGDTYSASINSSGQCVITKTSYSTTTQTRTETIDKNSNAGQANTATRNYWWYQPISYDVRAFKGNAANGLMAGGKVDFPVNTPSSTDNTKAANQPFTFGSSTACIEERKTLRTGETGTAWDMDVDSAPNPADADTQWRPFIPSIVFARSVTGYGGTPTGWSIPAVYSYTDYIRLSSQSSLFNACPSPARKLQTSTTLTTSVLKTYLDGLLTRGYTYHDIGFLWGLRLISREGIFGSENATAPNGSSIGRNIIFMTDGDTETHFQAYDAYGLSALDRRRTSASSLPSDSDQDAIVEDRLSKYCTIAKGQKGITVWVIAFGTSLTSLLENCASQGRAFQADNADELNATFAEIAAKIAQLRLTK
ncbi:Flp pilus assembly protein TadG [Novosphingobium chloroacetimidivorans]|uniref:Flp pilus assembly protein TadG n=1 Tax=Novosphingobium chloroacetimidivorans TaxID=1428314 RepID=A0A7W7KDS7_9SPHN|nr:Tad domain-containing protein [Novosphingobium chloroacetimidivorans]MBB4860987.1 Flp pilus assembly protein TadG [Novosphingobium chloroacetimidivorans]